MFMFQYKYTYEKLALSYDIKYIEILLLDFVHRLI